MSDRDEARRIITIGQLLKLSMFSPGPSTPENSTLIWMPPSSGYPAGSPDLARLERIAQNEWGTGLQPDRFRLLRDHLHWFTRYQDDLQVGSDVVDALTLDEAAGILEGVIGDPAMKQLRDGTPTICLKCGEPLNERTRVQRRGWCDDCRSRKGRVSELEVEIKLGGGSSYNQAGNNPFTWRFPEWRELSTFIREKYRIVKVDLDSWHAFRDWFMITHLMFEEDFLHLRLSRLLDLLRRPGLAATEPDRSTTPTHQALPSPSVVETPVASDDTPHKSLKAPKSNSARLKEPSSKAVQCYRLFYLTGSEKSQKGIALAVYKDRSKQYQVSRDLKDVARWIKAGNVLPDLDESKPKTTPVDPSKLDQGPRQDKGRITRK